MASKGKSSKWRPMNVHVRHGSRAEKRYRARADRPLKEPAAIAPGISPTPAHDLRFRGGKVLADLTFTNFYLGGAAAWTASDVQSVDRALAAAMSDHGLNNVMVQYFRSMPTSTFKPSHVLPGTPPKKFSQGDVEKLVASLFGMGSLNGFKFPATVFNFMLPRGSVLNDNSKASGGKQEAARQRTRVPDDEQSDSLHGLGGYHGSVHLGSATVYYAIGVYSEVHNGKENGIAVFDQPWKNVVATFYHELNEARTDPDVEDVIRGKPEKMLGWTSNKGEEVGDFPVFEANPLTEVFKEVPLVAGGTAPIQLQYSNGVHGPEGPRSTPYPFFKGR